MLEEKDQMSLSLNRVWLPAVLEAFCISPFNLSSSLKTQHHSLVFIVVLFTKKANL